MLVGNGLDGVEKNLVRRLVRFVRGLCDSLCVHAFALGLSAGLVRRACAQGLCAGMCAVQSQDLFLIDHFSVQYSTKSFAALYEKLRKSRAYFYIIYNCFDQFVDQKKCVQFYRDQAIQYTGLLGQKF